MSLLRRHRVALPVARLAERTRLSLALLSLAVWLSLAQAMVARARRSLALLSLAQATWSELLSPRLARWLAALRARRLVPRLASWLAAQLLRLLLVANWRLAHSLAAKSLPWLRLWWVHSWRSLAAQHWSARAPQPVLLLR